MKNFLLIATVATVSTSAYSLDYKFNLEGRADFNNINNKTTTATTTTKAKSNGFLSNVIRLNIVGSINDQLTYRMRYRFNKEGTATTRDDSTSALDLYYIDHKNSLFTTRFGKSNWSEAYGRESMVTSTDFFVTSDTLTAYNTNIGTYRFGVSALFNLAEVHKLTLALSNPNTAYTDTSGESKNSSLAYGVHYNSNLLEKKFQPVLSYTVAKQDADAEATSPKIKAAYTMMAAGFRSEALKNLTIDADWKQFNKKKTTATSGATDGKTSSLYAGIAYSFDSLTPFVQYVNDKFKNELATNNTDYKKNTLALGALWKPFSETNFRYHLVYSNSNKKFDSASATTKKIAENKIIFGIKADI